VVGLLWITHTKQSVFLVLRMPVQGSYLGDGTEYEPLRIRRHLFHRQYVVRDSQPLHGALYFYNNNRPFGTKWRRPYVGTRSEHGTVVVAFRNFHFLVIVLTLESLMFASRRVVFE
jgi:hypothetical protein